MDAMSKVPHTAVVESGREYWWCACGNSKNQPYCDGSHKGTSFTPLGFKTDQKLTVALCGCKKTALPPYCDGSHQK